MINNKSRYYSSLINSFIYPEYEKYIRDKLSSYYNNIDNIKEKIKMKIKFNYFDIIYKKILPKEDYYLNIKFYIPTLNYMNEDTSCILYSDNNMANKFQLKIYPTIEQNNISDSNIIKTIEAITFQCEYIMSNTYINGSLIYNKYGCTNRRKAWSIEDLNNFNKDMIKINTFMNYIKDVMIPELCNMWSNSLDIILQKPNE